MFNYIKIDDNKFVKVNSEKAEIIKKDELEAKIACLEDGLEKLSDFSDAKLLAWAKENYPDQTRAIEVTTGHLEEAQKDLEEINKL
jgi:hypothetical protein